MRPHWTSPHCTLSLCEERSVPPMFWCAKGEAWEDCGWGELFWVFKAQRITLDHLYMSLKPWRHTQEKTMISIALLFILCLVSCFSCVFSFSSHHLSLLPFGRDPDMRPPGTREGRKDRTCSLPSITTDRSWVGMNKRRTDGLGGVSKFYAFGALVGV